MKAVVLTIGNEILKGKTVNTNLSHIGQVLTYAGHDVFRELTVSDNPDEISWGIQRALESGDLIITTGGLGPTFDDMTVECISKSLGIETQLDKTELKYLEERYHTRGIELTEERLKMVRLPVGSMALHNPVGAAPGVYLKYDGKIIVILPGVPAEMKALLDVVLPELKTGEREYYEETFPLEGIMESSLAPLVEKIMKKWSGKVYIKSHPQRSEIDNPSLNVEVSSWNEKLSRARETVSAVVKEIKENYRDFVGK